MDAERIRDTKKSATSSVWCVLVPIVVAIFVYANSLTNPLIYDDESVILKNYNIRTWENFRHLFDKEYFVRFQELSYRPLPSFTYLLDYSTWGASEDGTPRAFRFHLTNVLVHASVGAIVFLFVISIVPRRSVATLAALVYVVHPVLTEVTNIAGFREDSLCALFFFLTLILFNQFFRSRFSALRYALSLTAFFFALLSKETAIVLPVVLVLQDAMFSDRPFNWKQRILPYAGLGAVLTFYIIVRFVLMKHPVEMKIPYAAGSLVNTIYTMPTVLVIYARLLFFPIHLSALYDLPPIVSPADVRFLLSVAIMLALVLYALLNIRKRSVVSFGILWFFITLAPVSNLVGIGNLMAERFLTVPLIGFCLLVGVWLHTASECGGVRKVLGIVVTGVFVVSLATLTITRNTTWGNERLVWRQTAICNPESGRAWDAVAQQYIRVDVAPEHKDWKRVERLTTQAIEFNTRLNRQDSNPYYHRGMARRHLGRLYEAERDLVIILPGDQNHPRAVLQLGAIYHQQRRLSEAKKKYEEAATLIPHSADPWRGLAHVARMERNKKAELQALMEAAKRMPTDSPLLPGIRKRISQLQGQL